MARDSSPEWPSPTCAKARGSKFQGLGKFRACRDGGLYRGYMGGYVGDIGFRFLGFGGCRIWGL